MDAIWYEELRKKYSEIEREEWDDNKTESIIGAYNRIFEFSNIARKEGILGLEEAEVLLDINNEAEKLFRGLIELIVNGADAEFIWMVGMNKCISMNLPGSYGLMALLYVQGSMLIRSGANPMTIDALLKSVMPKEALTELEKRDRMGAES